MRLVLFQGPQIEPLTVAEVKETSRISEETDDDIVEKYIKSARAHTEKLSGRALITQTWDGYMDCFPCQIDVPKPPLQSVTHIKYIDTEGTLQTLAASEYTVDTKSEPGRIVPAYGKSWPGTRYEPNAVQVRFVCGYGTQPSDIDAKAPELRQAIGVLAGTMFEQREVADDVEKMAVPEAYYQLVAQETMYWL